MTNRFSFCDRVGVLATMHHKEKVMTPLLEEKLGIKVVVPENFNTDAFGTFTREIKRAGDQLEAARRKAKSALALNQTLAFASDNFTVSWLRTSPCTGSSRLSVSPKTSRTLSVEAVV